MIRCGQIQLDQSPWKDIELAIETTLELIDTTICVKLCRYYALWAGIKAGTARLLFYVLMLIRLSIFGCHAEGEGESSLCKLTHKCYMSVELTAR